MDVNPLMIKKLNKIYCKLAKIKNKEGDYTLSVVGWIKKMKTELKYNSSEKVANMNFISLKIVEELDSIPEFYLKFL